MSFCAGFGVEPREDALVVAEEIKGVSIEQRRRHVGGAAVEGPGHLIGAGDVAGGLRTLGNATITGTTISGNTVRKGSAVAPPEREERRPYSLENPQIRRTVRRELQESRERELFNGLLAQLHAQHDDQVEIFADNLERWVEQRSAAAGD